MKRLPKHAGRAAAGLIVVMAATGVGRAGAAEGESLEQRVERLEARAAIRELLHAYGRALDDRDFVAFAELFAEEAGEWVGGFGSARGRDAIFELMDESIGHGTEPAGPPSYHVFANEQIEVDGARATATTKWIFVTEAGQGRPEWVYLGHYDDTFLREDGRWLFLRREASTDLPAQDGALE